MGWGLGRVGLPRCTHGFSFLTLFTPPNYTSSIEPFWTTIKENKMIWEHSTYMDINRHTIPFACHNNPQPLEPKICQHKSRQKFVNDKIWRFQYSKDDLTFYALLASLHTSLFGGQLAHASKAFPICKSPYVAFGFLPTMFSTFQSYETPQLLWKVHNVSWRPNKWLNWIASIFALTCGHKHAHIR